MRVVIAPTAFKGTLTPTEAATAMARGWRSARRGDDVVVVPMADGGDGTAEVIELQHGGRWLHRRVRGPLGAAVDAKALILPDGTAVVEMADASGLRLLDPGRLNPMHADTTGTGELIAACLASGAGPVYLGLGGSATVDGGAGCAAALGVRFLNASGGELGTTPADLERLHAVDLSFRHPQSHVVHALADVDSPLLGPEGAAARFGPQKGAAPEDVRHLEVMLGRLVGVLGAADVAALPGSGAAGGLGFGAVALLGATLKAGGPAIAELVGLDEQIAGADVVVTGEGRLDEQTLSGKAPAVVAARAGKLGVPCHAVVGSSALTDAQRIAVGFDRIVTLDGAGIEDKAAELAAKVRPT